MRKLLIAAIAFCLWAAPSLAQQNPGQTLIITPAQMVDANLATTNVQNLITTTTAFTAPRTLTIPSRAALNAFSLQVVDTANAINGSNTLTIVPANGTINGSASLVVTTPGAFIVLTGQIQGYSATVIPPIATSAGITQLTGDVLAGPGTGSQATTLATVNANVGTFGSATQCAAFTTNGKGLITAASQSACTPALTNLTGMGAGVTGALAIAIGSPGAPVVLNGAGGTPSSLILTNATGLPPSTGLSAAVPITKGGTGGTSAAVANITAIGGLTGTPSSTTFVRGDGTWSTTTGSSPGGSSGQIQYNNSGAFGGYTQSGDCTTNIATGVITCTKTSGLAYGPAATALAGQIPGTATNDSAASGDIGEFPSATNTPRASALSLTTATPINIASVSLTAGDWDVQGNFGLLVAATTTTSAITWGISSTSATMPTRDSGAFTAFPSIAANATDLLLPTPTVRVSLASTTTIYLVANVTFATSTATAYGQIRARRIR